ncbi:protein of unknown function [Amycolatopsis xylanica]|uniref:Transglutaminase-like domain-containing protein n=1 Tax=Amycolatopsis xylanica TaxID=589385 RepID=A0A1H3PCC7_9PSEU|nr:transglutaminaseTgpA domain-containing protein [Amycolatopsis xylanica]SDY98776.1 protein of unknown function [Amycolatopsis xylanica]
MNRRLIEAFLCAAAVIASGLVYGGLFATAGYLAPLGAATVVGVVVAATAALLHWRAGWTVVAAAGSFVLLAVYGVFGSTLQSGLPTRGTATAVLQGVFGGWARLLTVAPPADVRGDLLGTPVLLTWLAAFLATSLALRTRVVLAPGAPPVVAFAAALVLAGKQPGFQLLPTVLLLAAVLLLTLLRADWTGVDTSGHKQAMTSRLAFGLPAIAAIAALAVLSGQSSPLATGADRFDPRDLRQAPVRIADSITPLAKLKGQLREEPPRKLFTVRQTAGPRLDRIRVAALDTFDGVLWTSSDRFLVAGKQLAADPAQTRSEEVSAHITIDALPGPFLPEPGWPTRLGLAQDTRNPIGFSTASGVLATAMPLRGASYDVTGKLPVRDDGLVTASPSKGPEYQRYLALPGDLPPLFPALASQLTATQPTSYGKLAEIENYLRDLRYDVDAQPGHSYGALLKLLTGGPSSGGFAEQRASAFAVLARAAGFPARVAAGYRLDGPSTAGYTVTSHDVHAWAEVHFDGYGWVPFEPTDLSGSAGDGKQRPELPVAGQQPPNPPLGKPPVVAPSPDIAASPAGAGNAVARGAGLVAAVLAALLLLGVVLILAEKARRRWRRRAAPTNAGKVLGAWQEAVDRLIERGVPVSASLTAKETADRAVAVLGVAAGAVVGLAPLATAAVYAPREPDEAAVAEAWQLESQLRTQLYPRSQSLLWMRARLDPRPLLRGNRQRRGSLK